MQKESINSRSEIILGKENIEYLSLKKIAVIGLGGVGSIIPLILVRSNIRKIILIDNDFVNVSNLNRQIAYDQNDLGKPKVEALKEKLFNIRDDLEIEIYHKKIDANFDFNVLKDVNYVIDCIDDLEGKVLLTKYCYFHNIKIVNSLGMGYKLDPTNVEIISLNKTTTDPLAKKFRYLLKKENIDISKITTAFSSEPIIIKGKEIGSMAFVPNAAGLALASFVIREIIKEK